MGEFADYAIEEIEEIENHRQGYWRGEISSSEAFDRGLIDELGYMAEPSTGQIKKPLQCRCCGSKNVSWAQDRGKWRLFESNSLHVCPVNPLKEKEL